MIICFLLHCLTTLYMTGLIWFVQLVHYPLLVIVGAQQFAEYSRQHSRLTFRAVALPMLIEGTTTAWLLFESPTWFPAWGFQAGAVLYLLLVFSTAFIQVPCHRKLADGFDAAIHRRLVRTNWLRAVLWSGRSVLVLSMLLNVLIIGGFPQSGAFADHTKEVNMAGLKVGDKAPDFSATTSTGESVKMSDFVGKRGVVLFFYPKDGTAICTKEACAFRDSYAQFVDAGAEVIGISSDADASHLDFAAKNRLNFPLISDTDGTLRRLFAVPKTMGLFPGRVTYVIDRDGVIRQVFSAQFASDEHVKQALAALGR